MRLCADAGSLVLEKQVYGRIIEQSSTGSSRTLCDGAIVARSTTSHSVSSAFPCIMLFESAAEACPNWKLCGRIADRSSPVQVVLGTPIVGTNRNRKRWPVVENIQVWLPRHELNPRSHKHKCADPRHTCVITTNMQSRRGQYIFACNTGTVPSATRPFCVHFFPNESGGVLPSSTLCNSNHQRSFRMYSCKV
jgi:hypothetical protein